MPLPPDLVALPDRQHFAAETLFEIIDGDADLYLKAGFVGLDVRRFLIKGDPQRWIDMLVYRMEGHRSAFAVFSMRRGKDAQADVLTRFAYRYPRHLFFVHGPFYVEIMAADETPQLGTASRRLGAAFIDAQQMPAEAIEELAWLPSGGLIPDSVALHPTGAFGFEAFDHLFSARYRLDDREATAFFQRCRTAENAERLAGQYQTFLLEYDGAAVPAPHPPPNSRLIRVMGRYTMIFTLGELVAGVQEAETPQQAETLGRHLYEALAARRGAALEP
jgi:hypothetical protein